MRLAATPGWDAAVPRTGVAAGATDCFAAGAELPLSAAVPGAPGFVCFTATRLLLPFAALVAVAEPLRAAAFFLTDCFAGTFFCVESVAAATFFCAGACGRSSGVFLAAAPAAGATSEAASLASIAGAATGVEDASGVTVDSVAFGLQVHEAAAHSRISSVSKARRTGPPAPRPHRSR